MQSACAQAGLWHDDAPAGRLVGLWINVSPVQFGNERLVNDLAVAITSARIDPPQVTVEVTESSVIRDARQSTETLHRLRSLGVSVSIDDFGTGYSSLSRLGELPIDMLKIPKPFVDRLAGDSLDGSIVDAILRLASSLGLTVVAEGAETQEQVDRSRSSAAPSCRATSTVAQRVPTTPSGSSVTERRRFALLRLAHARPARARREHAR